MLGNAFGSSVGQSAADRRLFIKLRLNFGKAEIYHLYDAFAIHQNVGCFDIAMDHIFTMHVTYPLHQLFEHVFGLFFLQLFSNLALEKISQILI